MGSAYPTIAADVLAKYFRLNGKETVFITGSDEHGEKIATTAASNGKKPQVPMQNLCSQHQAQSTLLGDERLG